VCRRGWRCSSSESGTMRERERKSSEAFSYMLPTAKKATTKDQGRMNTQGRWGAPDQPGVGEGGREQPMPYIWKTLLCRCSLRRQISQGGPLHIPLKDPPRVGSCGISSWSDLIAAASLLACSRHLATPVLTSRTAGSPRSIQSQDTGRGVQTRLWRANRDIDVRRRFLG